MSYNGVGHAATFVNSGQLTIQLSASDQATAGTYAVVVTNPAQGGEASNSVNFTVNNPVPAITSLSPSSATAGAGLQTLTLNGSNFLASSTVTYNGVGHTATFVSSTQLTISLSAADQATAGSYAVVVTNPAPGGGASSPLNFAVGNPQPSLSSLSPA
ncbi:MAG: IPT/TIG domain-containing protein, partial [Terriglobia bacterium]